MNLLFYKRSTENNGRKQIRHIDNSPENGEYGCEAAGRWFLRRKITGNKEGTAYAAHARIDGTDNLQIPDHQGTKRA